MEETTDDGLSGSSARIPSVARLVHWTIFVRVQGRLKIRESRVAGLEGWL